MVLYLLHLIESAWTKHTFKTQNWTLDDMPNPKRIRSVKVASNHDGVATPFLSADTTDIERKSDCLREREICVLNGTESLPKQELEKKIVSGGGRVVQYPGAFNCFFLL